MSKQGEEMTYPFTRFAMTLRESSDLLVGEFSIHYAEHRYDVFPCSSGLRGYQTAEHFWTRGKGPIPPSVGIAGKYQLSTVPYYSAKVGGLFFHIIPDPIFPAGYSPATDTTYQRCEIGLHLDTHGPGTSGCEGLQDKGHFERICCVQATFRTNGILYLPHEVVYKTETEGGV